MQSTGLHLLSTLVPPRPCRISGNSRPQGLTTPEDPRKTRDGQCGHQKGPFPKSGFLPKHVKRESFQNMILSSVIVYRCHLEHQQDSKGWFSSLCRLSFTDVVGGEYNSQSVRAQEMSNGKHLSL